MKKPIIKQAKKTISRTTAEQSVPRSLQFLRAIGTDSSIRAAMQTTGFGPSDMKQGWVLVLTACAAPVVDVTNASIGGPVVEATQKLIAWQGAMLPRGQAALRRLHPEQEAFLFDNLTGGQGTAVVNVAVFLDRCDALESAPERKSTRKADHAALATLAQRGVTAEERKQARHLVHVIESTPAPLPQDSVVATDGRTEALVELHAWLQDWSDCARTVISRRAQLLRLGIGKRRSRAVAAQPVVVSPAPAPIVAPAPVIAELPQAAVRALPPAQLNGFNGAAHASS